MVPQARPLQGRAYTPEEHDAGDVITRYAMPLLQRNAIFAQTTALDAMFNGPDYTKPVMVAGDYEPFVIGYVNDRFLEVFGYAARGEVIGRTPKLLHGVNTKRVIAGYIARECQQAHEFPQHHTVINHTRQGRPLLCDLAVHCGHAFPGFDIDGFVAIYTPVDVGPFRQERIVYLAKHIVDALPTTKNPALHATHTFLRA